MDRDELSDEIAGLRRNVAALDVHRWSPLHNSMPRLIAFQVARRTPFGLGGVLGATVALSIVIWSLSRISFVPIIGDWVTEIVDIVQPQLGGPDRQ